MIVEITAIIGAITGSVSLGFFIHKTIKDKPSIHCKLLRSYYFTAHENDYFTNLSVEIKIDNKGSRNTTIYNSNLLIKNNDKEFTLVGSTYAFPVPQDSTVIQNFQFGLNKKYGLIEKDPIDSIMTIKHTYGEKKIEIKNINKVN